MHEATLILVLLLIAIGWIWVIRIKGGPLQAFRGPLGIPWWVQIIIGGLLLWLLAMWGR